MPGYLTSYAGLFLPQDTDPPRVTSIEIPPPGEPAGGAGAAGPVFSTTSTRRAGSRSTTGYRTWANGAVVAIRGCGPGRPTAGARCDRRRWDSAVGVRADYQGPSEELTRTITVAETKHNPLPPTLS